MKYYLIRNDSEPKIIGVKNGIYQVEISRDRFVNKISYDEIIEFFDIFKYWDGISNPSISDLKIECATLLSGGILTDFVSFSPHLIACHFMVSERAKSLFDKFKMSMHHYINVPIYSGTTLLDVSFHLFYCPYQDFDIVDFSKSRFYTGNKIFGKKYIKIESKEEYLKFLQENPLMQTEEVVLASSFDLNLHLFAARTGGVFASEELLAALKKEKLTGLKISDATWAVSA